MNPPSPSRSIGGGAPLALAVLLGTIIGVIAGQPTIGFLVGLALGVIAALLIWRMGR